MGAGARRTQRQTRWFYERARGQYADELGRSGTPQKQQLFKVTCPPAQKFTKTDLAKFVNSWDQLPYIVSLGAEKNFRELMIWLGHRGRAHRRGTYLASVATMYDPAVKCARLGPPGNLVRRGPLRRQRPVSPSRCPTEMEA